MLTLIINSEELFNDLTQEFTTETLATIELEHSLVSLSKWESKFRRPFLSSGAKTTEEILNYISCMVISPGGSSEILSQLTDYHYKQIQEYIDSSESATTFGMMPETKGKGEVVTSELIYYWMVVYNIPFECEKWHLNRLFALIKICNIKNSKPKKMSRHEAAAHRAQLNAQRRAELNSKG